MTPKRSQVAATLGATMRERKQAEWLLVMDIGTLIIIDYIGQVSSVD